MMKNSHLGKENFVWTDIFLEEHLEIQHSLNKSSLFMQQPLS